MSLKILLADDEAAIRRSISLTLSDLPYKLIEAGDRETAYQKIKTEHPDVLLLDVHFKEGTGLELMRRLVSESLELPTIVLSGAASAAQAAEAIQLGAYDFIEKPVSADRLRLTIERCAEAASLRSRLHRITVQTNSRAEIIGRSAESQKIRKLIEQYAPKDVKVLITGETGTGKEVIAQSIWRASTRRERPFIIVNSAAIPENLIESELFGHRKGSFTGAVSDQVGKIEMAERGTLFLDEVGDLSPGAQTKLLRFLESGEIQKVGSNQLKTVDVRLVAATSRDLEVEMEKGRFRADLFYRLNVARIPVPALRDRAEDIEPLFSFFVASFCEKFKEAPKQISDEALGSLALHAWPGNIRQLRNVAERVVLAAGPRILKEHLDSILGAGSGQLKKKESTSSALTLEGVLPFKEFKNKMEKEYIESVLSLAQGSITKAAQLLSLDRTYLHQKMTHHGITSGRAGSKNAKRPEEA